MTIQQIDQLIEEDVSLDQLAQAYAEIANLKIQRIRAAEEKNKIFLKEISAVYDLVKKMAVKKGVNITKPKKMVSLVITSNYPFYGATNYDLLDFFTSSTQKLDTDRIMLGKAAVDYFQAKPIFKNFQEVILSSDEPKPNELTTLVGMLKDYSQIVVFYSGFKSLLVQQPAATTIRGSSELHLGGESKVENESLFIFEPELYKILNFFDSQITTLLLQGVFLESELSRAASRFISMDQADIAANKFIKEYQTLKSYTIRNMNNNKILENFASMFSIRKELYK